MPSLGRGLDLGELLPGDQEVEEFLRVHLDPGEVAQPVLSASRRLRHPARLGRGAEWLEKHHAERPGRLRPTVRPTAARQPAPGARVVRAAARRRRARVRPAPASVATAQHDRDAADGCDERTDAGDREAAAGQRRSARSWSVRRGVSG